MNDLQKQIDELKKEVEALKNKRIGQLDILPDAIKMRHLGEGSRFIRSGLEADMPTVGESATDSVTVYYATDTEKLYVYNGGAWVSTTLS